MKQPIVSTAAIVLCATLALAAGVQQRPGAEPEPVEPSTPPPELPELPGVDDARTEMIELFRKVETRLNEIDKLLYDAGAGTRSLSGESLDSGLAGLLKDTRSKSQDAVAGIDRILEIAAEQQGSCQSAMSGGGKPSNSPGSAEQPQQGSGQKQQREATPEKPGQEPNGREPNGQDPQSEAKGGDPRSPKESNETPENRLGGPPPGLETRRVGGALEGDRWGELPEQYRELFRTEGGGEMPAQYRDWIDAYHRRLNQRR